MRIIVATVQVPFIVGGAELHANNLAQNLRRFGHEVEIVTFPFKFTPQSYISDMASFIEKIHFDNFGWVSVDKLIALRFPAYYVRHEDKVVWLLHQHRAVYDLYSEDTADADLRDLKQKITALDTASLERCRRIYANSRNVARRLKHYNGIDSTPLYHPPQGAEQFYCAEPSPYVFYPSRMEPLKRQDLVIEAMRYVKSDIKLILAGIGGLSELCRNLVDKYQLHHRVAILGHISESEKLAYYANSLGVVYAPQDEDYGYVTLEAMLSSKPVITCTDSGGPLEFVEDDQTGYIATPDPQALAEKIDKLAANRQNSKSLGLCGRSLYAQKGINWDNVVNTLLYGSP